MSISNLAIVFGPTLFGQQRGVQIDAALQNKARNLQSSYPHIGSVLMVTSPDRR